MKGQLTLVLEMKMKLEFIQVNPDGRSRILNHFYPRTSLVGGYFSDGQDLARNNLTVRNGSYREVYIRNLRLGREIF